MSEQLDKPAEFIVSEDNRRLVLSVLEKLKNERQHHERLSTIDEQDLKVFLTNDEAVLVRHVYQIDPTIYGFKGPKVGIEPVPDSLVRVEPQRYHFNDEEYYTPLQHIPEHTYHAFQKLSDAISDDLGRSLLIVSSYRSNPFQAIVFLRYLAMYDFDVAKTAKRVAVPGYSEHTTPSRLALDVATLDGRPSDENPQDFADTDEYRWLLAHAHEFDFYESYPKDNKYGVMYEPWHWRHMPEGNT